jgi:HAD superfamily hydrolase (TIGR01509 family)
MTVKAVIFDIDGTLIDSVDLHAEAWQEALRHFGHEIPYDKIRRQIGKGGDQLMSALLAKGELERRGEEIERYRSELFKEKYLPRAAAFPRVRELFIKLKMSGLQVALASSCKASEMPVYERLADIEDLVDSKTCGDDVDRSKPEPDVFEVMLRRLGVRPDEAIAVGDTPYDAVAAGHAGLRTVGVLSGGFPEDTLRKSGCIAIYRDPADMLTNYASLPLGGTSRPRLQPAKPHRLSRLGMLLAASAAALGVQALLVRHHARRAEREHPPQGRFIELDGVRLHYLDRGAGPPVVLLHGNGAMIEDFEISGIVDRLAKRYRVIVFDRPGFGHSNRPRGRAWTPTAQAELLRKALRELGIERPLVVGHSWGTLVALALALAHHNELSGLVLVSGYYFPTARADVALLSPPAIPVLGDVMRYTISPALGRLLMPKLLRKIFAPAPVTARFAAEFPTDLALRPSQIRASAEDTALMIPAAAALSHCYGSLALPIAIVAGTDDQMVDFERQARRLKGELPHSELHAIEGGGHMIHHIAPDRIVGAVDAVAARPAQKVSLDAAAE